MDGVTVPLICFLFGIGVGWISSWLLLRSRTSANVEEGKSALLVQLAASNERASRVPTLEQRLAEMEEALANLREENGRISAELKAERQHIADNLSLLQEAKERLSVQFKILATDILEDKSKRFTEQNASNLEQLLEPFKQKIDEFKAKVEDIHHKETQAHATLIEKVANLTEKSAALSQVANNLAEALKGSNKVQGCWGEIVLNRVLEVSGLRKGEEYDIQESHTREDGSRAQPDVVIHLPEDRHLVVDAKVSLSAYEDYVSQDDDAMRKAALKRHLDSVRTHIRSLSDKNYQSLYGIRSLDFVLMFMPIDSAFILAVSNDRELFKDALHKNVLLVCPSTLLFVVRTVAHLWRQEAQSRNAQEIAKRGAELYDRLVSFVNELQKVGARLEQAQHSYDDAWNKLTVNKGNVIRQAEMLKDLGVKPSKVLSPALVEQGLPDGIDEFREPPKAHRRNVSDQ